MFDAIKSWLDDPAASSLIVAVISLVLVAVVVRAVQHIARFLATAVIGVLVVLGAGLAYLIVLVLDGSNGQVLMLAAASGVFVGVITIPLLTFATVNKADPGSRPLRVPLLGGLWSRLAGAYRQIARVDLQWTSGDVDAAAAASRGIHALDEIERRYTLSAFERSWLTNLRNLMRTYLPGGGNYRG